MPANLPGLAQHMPALGVTSTGQRVLCSAQCNYRTDISTSFTYIVNASGLYQVYGVGGAGGGGRSGNSNYACGGGAATVGRRLVSLVAGQVITGTLGVCGFGKLGGSGNGVAGGNTTIVFPDGVQMVCPGGLAGMNFGSVGPGQGSGAAQPATGADEFATGNSSVAPLTGGVPVASGATGTVAGLFGNPGLLSILGGLSPYAFPPPGVGGQAGLGGDANNGGPSMFLIVQG